MFQSDFRRKRRMSVGKARPAFHNEKPCGNPEKKKRFFSLFE